jgi:Carboxypeptidase regulatory-like domain/TonB dependent receptor
MSRLIRLLPLVAVPLCFSQEFRSTISGRVVDPADAVVPGARIEAIQVETGSRTEATAAQDGQYTLPLLLPGTYRVSAEAPGMKRMVREGIIVTANERIELDMRMELGAVSEKVTVTADAPLLEASSGSVGEVISHELVDSIPVDGRTPMMMASLWSGVTPLGGPTLTRPFDNNHTSDFSVGGAPGATNELLIDGAPNANGSGVLTNSPPMDAVTHLKVESFQSDAAYGNTGGGTINVILKSGTNELHGSAYEYNSVSRLSATPFFTNLQGKPKPVTVWNQYGFTAGGPVTIPRLFNGRDKLFFFIAYESIKEPNPLGYSSSVPTAAERRGDFSQLLALNSSYTIYDPFSAVPNGARIRRNPFPDNIIPQNRLNPISLKVLEYWPLPNTPGGADGRNNFFTTAPQFDTFNSQVGRLDFNMSPRHKLFFTERHNNRDSREQNYYAPNIARGRRYLRYDWNEVLDDVYTLTPTTVLNTRLSADRFFDYRRLLSTGFDMTTLGFPAKLQAAAPLNVLPEFDFSNYSTIGEHNQPRTPYTSFQIFSSVTNVHGRHTAKFGTDLRLYRQSNYSAQYSSGRYVFNQKWANGPADNSAASPIGQDLASFMMGLPNSGQFDLNAQSTTQSGYIALFVQDDFRLAPSLTLNLGLRYEKDQPTTERYNRMTVGFDPSAVTSVTAAAKAAYGRNPDAALPVADFNPVGGLLFASPQNRNAFGTSSHDFSPRFGFAWKPAALGHTTVIRGGTGLFFFNLKLAGLQQTGFSQSTSYVTTTDGYLTPYASLSNPFPDGIQQPQGAGQGVSTYLGKSFTFAYPNPSTPYTVRWNLNIQHQFAQNLMAEIGYMGMHGVHQGVNRQLDFVPAQYLSTSPTRDTATINFLTAQLPNPFANLVPGTNLNGSTISRSTLLQAYPQYTGVTAQAVTDGSSYGHFLMARLSKRFSAGLQLQANMQYSRVMQKLDRLNDSDPSPVKRVADIDRPFRAVVSGVYQLPIGRGKRVFGSAHGFANQIAGGWAMSGVFTKQSGDVLQWDDDIYLGGNLNWDAHNVNRAFDTKRFVTASGQQLSNDLRRFPIAFSNLRGDGIANFDLAVIKSFPIHERVRLVYHCEFFNAFNHPVFTDADNSPTSTTFGQITNQLNLPRHIQMALKLTW